MLCLCYKSLDWKAHELTFFFTNIHPTYSIRRKLMNSESMDDKSHSYFETPDEYVFVQHENNSSTGYALSTCFTEDRVDDIIDKYRSGFDCNTSFLLPGKSWKDINEDYEKLADTLVEHGVEIPDGVISREKPFQWNPSGPDDDFFCNRRALIKLAEDAGFWVACVNSKTPGAIMNDSTIILEIPERQESASKMFQEKACGIAWATPKEFKESFGGDAVNADNDLRLMVDELNMLASNDIKTVWAKPVEMDENGDWTTYGDSWLRISENIYGKTALNEFMELIDAKIVAEVVETGELESLDSLFMRKDEAAQTQTNAPLM